jgi:hypothetical protein
MALHRRHEGTIGDDDLLRPHREGEGDIQSVICTVVDGETDLQRDVVQTKLCGRAALTKAVGCH